MTSVDFNSMLKFSPAGCFIAENKSKNVGMINTIKYYEMACIGNLIVTLKNRGYGIWKSSKARQISF